MNKKCFKCKKTKPISEFYKHNGMKDGHLGKCKKCTKKDTHENYNKNIDHYKNYEQQRCKKPIRKQKVLEYQRKTRANDPQKARTRNITSNAIRDGKIKKQPCETCGRKNSEAHHTDYSDPYKIQWLCRKHHLEIHGKKQRTF